MEIKKDLVLTNVTDYCAINNLEVKHMVKTILASQGRVFRDGNQDWFVDDTELITRAIEWDKNTPDSIKEPCFRENLRKLELYKIGKSELGSEDSVEYDDDVNPTVYEQDVDAVAKELVESWTKQVESLAGVTGFKIKPKFSEQPVEPLYLITKEGPLDSVFLGD